ncbi:MAG: FHA domain-containing protein [Gammaproteobacteria bacterium]|nr:FHA domain-containing protein [Gammaproteobacteria bacterium]
MAILAAHLNDAAVLVTSGERVLYCEPGFALLEDDGIELGDAAYANARLKPRRIQNRYWSDLKSEPLTEARFTHLSTADLVSRQLEQIWQRIAKPGDRLAVAVPAYMDNEQLGLLLGIAMELGIDVVAMVDAAVAATRRQYEHAVPTHIDMSLHAATLTRLMQEGQVQVERSAVVDDAGLLQLHDSWLRTIAEAFVQQSRFDPLHTAETEQALQDRLPGWLQIAARDDKVPMDLEYRGIEHHAEIESLELVAAAAPVYQNLVSNLRALYRAGETPAIQLSDRAARLPGLAATLKNRVGGEVFLLEQGATARGLLQRCRDDRGAGGLTLVRHLPWDQAPLTVQAADTAGDGGRPTHLLFGHEALAVGGEPLVLGTQAADGERWLDLGADMPGVSRRHCAVSEQNGRCVVTDYSRYGTFLNGHRIDGTAVLQSGDILRIGTPGFELRLISAEATDGA